MAKSSSNQSWQELGQQICPRCGLKTSDPGLFQAHHCRIRLPTNKSPQITAGISYSFCTRQYTCSLCRVDLLENEFREHLECHFSVNPYMCKYCSSRFETVVEAFEHLKKSHSGGVQEVNLFISNQTKELMQKAKNHGKVFYRPVNVNVIKKMMPSKLSPTTSVQSQQLYIVMPGASTYSKAPSASTAEHGKQILTVFTGQRDAKEKKQLPQAVKQNIKDPKSSYCSRPLATVAPLEHTPATTPSSLSSNTAPLMAQNFSAQISAPPMVTRKVSRIFHPFSTVSPLTSFRPPYLNSHNYSNFSNANTNSVWNGIQVVPCTQSNVLYLAEPVVSNSQRVGASLTNVTVLSTPLVPSVISTLASPVSTLPSSASTLPAHSALSADMENDETNKTSECLGLQITNVISLSSSSVREEEHEDHTTETPLLHQNSNGVIAEEEKEAKETVSFNYLQDVKGYLLCLKCKLKWYKDYDLFLHHVWKKHAHDGDFSCCPKGYSLKCSHLRAVVEDIYSRSQEPESKQILNYLKSQPCSGNKAPSPQLSNNLTNSTCTGVDTQSINTIVPVTSNEEIPLNNSTLHEQFQSQEICHEPYQTLNNSTISNTSHLINQIMQESNKSTLNDTVRPHTLQELNVQKQLPMNTKKTSEDIAGDNNNASRKDVNSSSIIEEISWPIREEIVGADRPLDLSQKMPRVRKRIPVNKSVSRLESQDFPTSDSLPSDKYNVLKSFFQCGFCKCQYNSPKSVDLSKHMEESHSLDSEYTCSYCGYKCHGGVDFLHHLKGHIGSQRVKTYSCSLLENSCRIAQFENEDNKFIMRMLETSLEAYNTNSDAEFQFSCNICSTAFESVHDLMAHLNKFLLKIVTCKYCESYFLDTDLWQKHMTSDHVDMSRMYHINKKLLCHDYNLNRTINSQITTVRNVPVLDNVSNKNIMNSVMEKISENLINLVTEKSSVQNEHSRLSDVDETLSEPCYDPDTSVQCTIENDRNQTGVVSCLVDNGFSNETEPPVQNADGSKVSNTTADCSRVDSPIQETMRVILLIDEPRTLDMPALRGPDEKIPREMDVPNVSEFAAPDAPLSGISEAAIGFLPLRLTEVPDENVQDKPPHQAPDNPDSVIQNMAETTTQDMSEPVAQKCDMINMTSPRLHQKTVTSEPEALPVFGQSDVSESVTQEESEFAIHDLEPGRGALQVPVKTGTQVMFQSVTPECITHNVPLSKPQKIPETIIQDVAYNEIESAIQDVNEIVPQNGDQSVAQDVLATSSQPVSTPEADVTVSEIVTHHVPQVRAQDVPTLISKEASFNGTKIVPVSQTELPMPREDIDKHNLKIKSTILSLASASQVENSCNNEPPEISTPDATLIRDDTVRLRCYICDYWSIDQEDFLNHVISKKHSIFNSLLFAFKEFHIVKCMRCGYVANGSPDLVSHITSEHISCKESLTKKDGEFCDILPSAQRLQSMDDISVEKETATVPNQSLSASNSQKISVPPVSSTHYGELTVSVENEEECTATRPQAFNTSKSGQNETLPQSKTFSPNSGCTYKGSKKEYLNKENRKINNEILTSDENTDVHAVVSSGDIEAHEKVVDTDSHCMKSSKAADLAARIVACNRVVEEQQTLNPVLTEKKLTDEIQLPANTKEDRSALSEVGATQKTGKRQKTKLQALHMKTALEVAKKHNRVEQSSGSPDIVPAVHKQTAVLNDSASPVCNRLDKTTCQTEVDKSLSANAMALEKNNHSDTHRSTECGPAEHHSEETKNMKSDGSAVMKSSLDCDTIISQRGDALLTRNALDSCKSTNQALKPAGSHEGKGKKVMLDNSIRTAICEKVIGRLTSNAVDSHKVLKLFKRKQDVARDMEAKKVKLDNCVHTTVCEKANKLSTSNSTDSHKASSPALKPIKRKLQESHEGGTKKTKLDNSVVHSQHKPSVLETSDSDLSPRFKCSVCTSWTSYSYTKMKQHLEIRHVGNKLAKLLRIPSESQKTVSSESVIKNQKNGLYRCILKNCDFTCDWKDDIMREHMNSKHPLHSCGYCNVTYHFLNNLQNHQKFVHRGKESYIITGNIPLEKFFVSISGSCDDAREKGKKINVKKSNGKKVSGTNKKSVSTDSPAGLATVTRNQAEGKVPKVAITEREPHSSANWVADNACAGVSSKKLHESKIPDSQISLKEHKLTQSQKNRVTCNRIIYVDKGETVHMNLTEVSREDINVGMKTNNTSEDKSTQNTSSTSQNSGPNHDQTAAPGGSMKHDKLENQPRPVNGETSVSKHAVTEQGQRTESDHQQVESNVGQQTIKKIMTLDVYPFRCTICKTRQCFKTLCDAEEHFKWLHTEKEVQLNDRKTKAVFTATGMFIGPHMKLPARRHLCKYCPFRSKMRSDVEVHVKTKHPLKEIAVITLHHPDQHLATGSTEPRQHLANDSVELQFAEGENHDISSASRSAILTPSWYCCHLCDDLSSTEFLFRLHLAKHPGFKHTTTLTTACGLLVCPTCGYIAKSKGDLAQHTGQHFKERRFMCSHCNTDSHVKKSLESHIKNTHLEEEHATVLDRKVLHSANLKPKLVSLDLKVLLIDPFKQHPNYLQKLGLKEGIKMFDFPADICSNILAFNNDEFFNTFYV